MVTGKKKQNTRLLHPLILSSIVCLFMVLSGTVKISEHYGLIVPTEESQIIKLSGYLNSNPIKKGAGKFYRADFSVNEFESKKGISGKGKGIVCILIPAEMVECFLPGKLYSRIKDEEGTICEQGLEYELTGSFLSDGTFRSERVKRLRDGKGLFRRMFYWRGILRTQFRRLMFEWGAAGGLLLALLSGIKEYTEDSLNAGFRKAGLSHILALSGMHLNMFSGMASRIGKKLAGAKLSALLQSVSVLIFVLFAGFSPSLFRAFLCSLLSTFVVLLKLKEIKMIHILSASFLIHISLKPYEIHETAFMLSYGALAGILIVSEFIKILFIIKAPGPVSDSLSSSSAAQIFTIPVSLKVLGTFAPGGIISTMLISPLITIFIYTGLVLIILCTIFPFFVPYTVFLEEIFYTVIKTTVLLFAKIPFYSTGP